MREVRFDHIAMAAPRIADAQTVLVGELGGTPHHAGSSGVYRFAQWSFEGGGRLEVLEPTRQDGFLQRFLVSRGAGVHHVTFRVLSLREACDRAVAHGYRIVGYNDADPRWSEAFLHPKEALGIVVQLAESRRLPTGARPSRPPAPLAAGDSPRPVTILGLRTRARSRERARAQWGGILQGESSERNGTLVYRWPRSPLRLTVEIDPAGEEGPICIEYWSERPVNLPEGLHPVLGAVFARREAPDAD